MTTSLNETRPLASASHKAAFDVSGAPIASTGASAILLVSVGADYHEGEKLGATIDLINRSDFGRVSVSVADTLQRHNYGEGDARERHRRAFREGTEWIERNQSYLDQLDCPHAVARWDYSLASPDYGDLYDSVEGAYSTDAAYRDAIDTTVDRFIERRRASGNLIDEDELRNRCRTYLFEECPIIMPLWAREGFDFVIYPQKISAAMGRTRELFVEPSHPDRVQWLPLRFKKRKSARP
ncbi:tRNA-dependent cyclodipeptide synthase [Williamsia sp.]|uniref:tRNA-dependent cyclodipeptide synthase n=1 Tax=Williamsia sp. TaxID=1872085 RepID=UPI001A240AB5|nr:tRNA-dependent cyclodipeptide synthase [Williamsia sp.]MBJ7289338.1 tRNA-dependent cyclodipeptide synthase [Williamsia sp.]